MSITVTMTRLRRVIDDLYAGNMSVLSRDCGVNLSLLSKYLSGKLQPGRRVLEKVARPHSIRVDWFMGAGGNEIEYEKRADVVEGLSHSRPVFENPVKAIPSWGSLGLGRRAREVQPFYDKPSVYWIYRDVEIPDTAKAHYLLIETVEERTAVREDLGKRCVRERNGELGVEKITKDDISKSKIYGYCRAGQWDE